MTCVRWGPHAQRWRHSSVISPHMAAFCPSKDPCAGSLGTVAHGHALVLERLLRGTLCCSFKQFDWVAPQLPRVSDAVSGMLMQNVLLTCHLQAGCSNLVRHVQNARMYGVPVVVAINAFATDSDAEMAAVREAALQAGEATTRVCGTSPPHMRIDAHTHKTCTHAGSPNPTRTHTQTHTHAPRAGARAHCACKPKSRTKRRREPIRGKW